MAMVYGYNDANHLNAVTDIDLNGTNRSFSYDLNGNMTTGDDLTDPAAVVSRGISYTVDNMPDSVTRGAATTNFIYDGDGRRAKKTAGSDTTVYVSNLYEIINAAAVKYIFAGNLRIAKIAGTDIEYFHKDHLGSSTVMTNASGNSVETSEYLPHGGTRDQSGTSVSDYRFTDQELDTSTGLYNYDARLYDPVIGRFVSADTIVSHPFDPQGLNRYSYCRNNPLIYVDPSGHSIDPSTTDPGSAIKDANKKAKAEGLASLSGNDLTGNENSEDTEEHGRSIEIAKADFSELENAKKKIQEDLEKQKRRAIKLSIELGISNIGLLFGFPPTPVLKKGLGTNPFKGKTSKQIDNMFKVKGFKPSGPNPLEGKGGYVDPKSGRSYHIDKENKLGEPAHVDVNRLRDYKGPLDKRKYGM